MIGVVPAVVVKVTAELPVIAPETVPPKFQQRKLLPERRRPLRTGFTKVIYTREVAANEQQQSEEFRRILAQEVSE